jgi:hypothetical protein
VQPDAVKPQAVRTRPAPKAKTASTREINPGDLVCGQCGEGNDPARKFCRRCGASLQKAVVFTLPWYKRWWHSLTTRKTKAAGARPKTRRRLIGGAGPGWLSSVGKIIAVVAVVGFLLFSFVGPWQHTLRDHVSRYYHNAINVVHTTYNPVHPPSATATSAAPGHGAALAIDGITNTSWATATAANNGVGQSLIISVSPTTNIDKIGFLNGDQDTSDTYLAQPRPSALKVVFRQLEKHKTASGAETTTTVFDTKDFALKDTQSFQSFGVSAKNVTTITITIQSVYKGSSGHNAAIAEVELFKKS